MKKSLAALSLMTMLWSCTKKEDLSQAVTPGAPVGTANSAADGRWDLLGFGYDITGEYANSNSSRYQVIDVERLKLAYPTNVDMSGAETLDDFFKAGQNAEDFTRTISNETKIELSVAAGSTGGGTAASTTAGAATATPYKGTVDLNFTKTDKWSSKYVYATYNTRIVKRGVKMIPDLTILRNYLTPGFIDQLNRATPKDLVSYYGTHVLTNIKLGGQLSIVYQAETNNTDRTQAAKVGASFGLEKVFNVSSKYSYDQNLKTYNFNETYRARAIGGAPHSFPGAITLRSDGTPSYSENLAGWAAGVTDANAEMIAIEPNSAIPLYEFVTDPTKRDMLKNYINQYLIENASYLSYGNDPNHDVYSTLDGMGDHVEGGGVALGNINGNATPDAIFMAYDAPDGPNQFRYQVAYDMSNGVLASTSNVKYVPGLGDHCEGSAIAIADIDRDGLRNDLVLMAYDAPDGPNRFRYKIGFNMNANGDPAYWSSVKDIAGIADAARGAGISFGDIDGNGIPEVILMAYDIPAGANQIRYKVGYNLSPSGDTNNWSSVKFTAGLADVINGAAISLADVDRDGTLDLVLFAENDPQYHNDYRYKIGYHINASGIVASWSPTVSHPASGDYSEGAGIAFGNLDGNPATDVILMSIDAPNGPNEIRYKVGLNLDYQGNTFSWK